MPSKSKKSKKSNKSKKRPHTQEEPFERTEDGEVIERRVQAPREGQVLGRVVQIMGGGWLHVQCEDDKLRNCRIRGKIRKRMWIRIDDVVLIEPWYDMQVDQKGDVILRYTKTQARWLQKHGYLKTGTIEFD